MLNNSEHVRNWAWNGHGGLSACAIWCWCYVMSFDELVQHPTRWPDPSHRFWGPRLGDGWSTGGQHLATTTGRKIKKSPLVQRCSLQFGPAHFFPAQRAVCFRCRSTEGQGSKLQLGWHQRHRWPSPIVQTSNSDAMPQPGKQRWVRSKKTQPRTLGQQEKQQNWTFKDQTVTETTN